MRARANFWIAPSCILPTTLSARAASFVTGDIAIDFQLVTDHDEVDQ